MKRIVLFVLGVLAVSTSGLAQAPAADIEKALTGAPANLREGATVVKWKPDYTYDTLKKGTNRLVCFDRSGFPQQQPFSIECTSIANLDRVAQNLKFEAAGDKGKTQAMLDAAEKDGTRVKPEFGSVWYHVTGPDREHTRTHVTIAVPGATTQSIETDNKGPGSFDPGTAPRTGGRRHKPPAFQHGRRSAASAKSISRGRRRD